jgi:cell division transport system permease protein
MKGGGPRAPSEGAAASRRPNRLQAFALTWGTDQLRALVSSLGRLWQQPLASLMSAAVVGTSLALPAGMFRLLDNLDALSQAWGRQSEVSVFLKEDAGEKDGQTLEKAIGELANVTAVKTISPEDALAEFQTLSGFGSDLGVFEENPFPFVIVVTPAASGGENSVAQLVTSLKALPRVDSVRVDMDWVQRLEAVLAVGRRAVLIVGALLGMGVLLVIGNTIRLDIENNRHEIEISKLVGATDALVRRPFLLAGVWLGVIGGFIAWLLVESSLAMLANPVAALAALYESDFRLAASGMGGLLDLLMAGTMLGLLGAWLAVGHQLRKIVPH